MKTIRIQKNWLVKAIKSGVLNVSDIPYKSWDEKAKIDAIISKIKVYWKDASKSLLSNMIIPSEKYTDAVFESIPSFIKSGILSENIENERVCLLVDSENIKGASFCIFYPKYNSYLLYVIKEEYLLTSEFEKTNEAYAIATVAALKTCEFYNKEYGMNFISLMPPNLYGQNDNFNMQTAHLLPMASFIQ